MATIFRSGKVISFSALSATAAVELCADKDHGADKDHTQCYQGAGGACWTHQKNVAWMCTGPPPLDPKFDDDYCKTVTLPGNPSAHYDGACRYPSTPTPTPTPTPPTPPTPSPTPPSPASSWGKQPWTNCYVGHGAAYDVDVHPGMPGVSGEAACEAACDNYAGCTSITLGKSGECYRHTGAISLPQCVTNDYYTVYIKNGSPAPAPIPDPPTAWSMHGSTNCYEGHGSTNDIDRPGAPDVFAVGLLACEKACDSDASCTAITVGGDGQCYRRTLITDITQCLSDPYYTTYRKQSSSVVTAAVVASWGKQPWTNCYVGHGAQYDVDVHPGMPGVSGEAACEAACGNYAGCTSITLGKSGECYRHTGAISLPQCVTNDYYTTYIIGVSPAPAPIPDAPTAWATYGSANCYEGHGSQNDLDKPGAPYMNAVGLLACEQACDKTSGCTAITVGTGGECFRRTLITSIAQCATDPYYTTYTKNVLV